MPKPGLTRREMARAIVSPSQTSASSSGTNTPVDELVNSLEFAEQARRVLPEDVFSSIAGSDRSIFDRYTFRPRMNVSTLDMNLSVSLLGQELFTPLAVGPVSRQQRFHAEGERATLTGASAADTVTIISHDTTVPLSDLGPIAREASQPLWVAIDADDRGPERARSAVDTGADALFVNPGRAIDWSLLRAIRSSVDVPLVLKGVTAAPDARRAVDLRYDGLVVSTYSGAGQATRTAPLEELQSVVAATENQVPVLVDGSFRRATDVLVALILGARAVLLARPVMWAVAAYGADGVTTLLRMLQKDLARCFAMLGASTPEALTRNHLKIHSRER